jgi:hypothetical protein
VIYWKRSKKDASGTSGTGILKTADNGRVIFFKFTGDAGF